MRNIKAGTLLTRAGAAAGEYWTCETIGMHNEICISWNGQLLSMDKGLVPDWAQLHKLLLDERAAPWPYIPELDPFDVGFDVE